MPDPRMNSSGSRSSSEPITSVPSPLSGVSISLPLCFHMTYLQLSIRGIPALVTHGNSLTLESFARAWTPPTIAFYDHHGRLFPEAPPPDAESIPDEEPVMAGEQLVLL